jgi:hypothetical protein
LLQLPSILFGAAFSLGVAYALGVVSLRRLAAPPVVNLAVGAAIESTVVFLLLSAGIAGMPVFAAVGVASFVLAWRAPRPALKDPVPDPAGRTARIVFAMVFACYGVFYFVHALAPETQPDGMTYHLGLVAEYLRLGRFPDRVGFFEMVPQGLEMLFLPAFAFGRHSAAKLVHFAFLLATVPLMLRVGRRLGLADTASLAAAGIYLCAPVAGISGTCSYNDAALVFFILVTFYLLLVWRQQHDDRYLIPAGLTAGFCYAIKFTGILILPVVMLAALALARRWRPPALLGVGMLVIAPWMARNAIASGNPLAPLFNGWFVNPYFHAYMERGLLTNLRSYGAFQWRTAFVELSTGGRLQGIYGPLLLAFPLGLAALRRRAGLWCWAAAAVVAVPWFWNVGARFLMPAFAFAALAGVSALPPRAALACFVFQAVSCWPQVIALYNPTPFWTLRGFPWQAVLRLSPEADYLADFDEYKAARMIEDHTRPGERVFALSSVATAYTEREVLEFWHSATGDRLLDALSVAGRYTTDPFFDVKLEWPHQTLRALRFRLRLAHAGEWCIHEIRLLAGEDRVHSSPQWSLGGWPYVWEMPSAFDDNLATRWRTWGPMRPGMFVEVDLDRPQVLTGATLISHTPVYRVPMEFYGLGTDGRWRSFGDGRAERRVWQDIRKPATHNVRRAGYRYILAPSGNEGAGPLGALFVGHEAEWGLERVAEASGTFLFRIP